MRSEVTYGHEEPPPRPGLRWLELGDGHWATVDEADWRLVMPHRWFINEKGTPVTNYKQGDRSYTQIQLKVMVLGKRAGRSQAIKNLDGDPLNCTRANVKLMSLKEARALDRGVLGPVQRKAYPKNPKRLPKPDRPAREKKRKFRLFED